MFKSGLSIALILSLAGLASAQETPAAPKAPAADKQPEAKKPEKTEPLKLGDKAPALSVEKWIKGEPVTGFEKGKVYVVEFWATWCGPCIAMFPHLSEIQTRYKDKGLTVIGTNIWEDAQGRPPYSEKTLPAIQDFVTKQDSRMGYAVAYDGASKAMDSTWMKAAGRGGIPTAFVVDQNGTIAFLDHPFFLDACIDDILAGKWDAKAGAEKIAAIRGALNNLGQKLNADPKSAVGDWENFEKDYPAFAKRQTEMKLRILVAVGDWDKTYKFVAERTDEAIKEKDAGTLNALAWTIVDPQQKIEKPNIDLAMKAASEAVKITGEKDGETLDTLARCHWLKGDKAKAIELQKKAISVSTGRVKAQLEETLKEYEAGAK